MVKNERVLVFGGAGFIGSHLVPELLRRGYQVTVVDVHPGWSEEQEYKGAKFERCSIADADAVRDLLKWEQPDHVVDLAGISHTVSSHAGVRETLKAGAYGLATLIDQIRKLAVIQRLIKVPHVYIASSSLCSGVLRARAEMVNGDETVIDMASCYHPYPTNKLCMEMLLQDQKEWLPFTIMRFGTTFGPRMAPFVFTWNFILRALVGLPLYVHGDGKQWRQHLYVEDLVNGIVACIEKHEKTAGKIVSLVPPWKVSVIQMATMIKEIVEKEYGQPVVIEQTTPRPVDIRVNWISPREAWDLLKWKAQIPVSEGLKKTIAWYKERIDAGLPIVPKIDKMDGELLVQLQEIVSRIPPKEVVARGKENEMNRGE